MEYPIIILEDPLATLKNCDGYYECPKGPGGKRLGPLVGYAGTYDAPDSTKKAFVGEVYYNFARAEQFPTILIHFAKQILKHQFFNNGSPDTFLGAPMGGILLASALSMSAGFGRRGIFAEKKITALASPTSREQSVLVIDRHEIIPGEYVALVEDVCNNFSTTGKTKAVIEQAGAKLGVIICFLNRSEQTEFEGIPVVSLLHIPTKQWKQEDPEVAEDIKTGNVVWKPKNEWPKLKAAMQAASEWFGEDGPGETGHTFSKV